MNIRVPSESSNQRFVVLLEGDSSSRDSVRQTLADYGFRTWEANDVCHAFEELSDFTVKARPDAVLLGVTSIDQSFDDLRTAFKLMSEAEDITVLGLCEGRSALPQKPLVAGSVGQLKRIIRQEVRRSAHIN
jgi:hypothetical protein